MQTTSVFLPGKSHGQRSLAVYSPWGRKKSDMTERLHFHFHSAYKLNKQGDDIHPWCTPFPILNQPALSKTIWTIFPTAFSYLMSLSHFGDSGKISDFFIMIILLQWFVIRGFCCCYFWGLGWWLAVFRIKYFLIKICILFFKRHMLLYT